MAKKLNVTPEMEESLRKANISDEAIARLKETEIEAKELSPDDLDGVAGGELTWGEMSELECYEIYLELTRNFGFDVAHEMFMAQTGYTTYYRQGFNQYATNDEEKMKVVLSNFWDMVAQGGGHYH